MPAATKDSAWMEKRARQRGLYPRQKEALQLYSQGLRYQDIAAKMGVAAGTISSYVGAAVVALGASDLTDAVRIAIERGEIEPVQGV